MARPSTESHFIEAIDSIPSFFILVVFVPAPPVTERAYQVEPSAATNPEPATADPKVGSERQPK